MVRWQHSLIKRCRRWLRWLWEQEGSPGQRARGLAAGVFCGCFPFFGLQTLLGIGLASVVRGNHLLAAAGTWISNPFTYLPLYWFNYRVGDALMGRAATATLTGINKSTLWHQSWSFTSRLLLGSSIVGVIFALSLGSLAWWLFRLKPSRPHGAQVARRTSASQANKGSQSSR
jgi:uncharacterized protein (DUF2062 family)